MSRAFWKKILIYFSGKRVTLIDLRWHLYKTGSYEFTKCKRKCPLVLMLKNLSIFPGTVILIFRNMPPDTVGCLAEVITQIGVASFGNRCIFWFKITRIASAPCKASVFGQWADEWKAVMLPISAIIPAVPSQNRFPGLIQGLSVHLAACLETFCKGLLIKFTENPQFKKGCRKISARLHYIVVVLLLHHILQQYTVDKQHFPTALFINSRVKISTKFYPNIAL